MQKRAVLIGEITKQLPNTTVGANSSLQSKLSCLLCVRPRETAGLPYG